MTREQAINYLICRGITEYQVSEIVRALTYKPRDCANCKHYIVKDTRTNWGSQETTKIYGCERWECEYEPTTKNNLGVDLISREQAKEAIRDKFKDLPSRVEINTILNELPSVTPQLFVPEVTALAEWTEKLTKASEDAYNKGYADGKKAQEPILDKINKMKSEIADSLEFWDYSPNNNPLARDMLETITNFWGDMREVEE